ncbi:hypothetical protein GE278_22585 (plasmid) [Enterobacteriaceae bacterium Kacie_13]|nr:hypothetical protein GE278_22585 [Enterobacteriaceae bacterium Kacie_13]
MTDESLILFRERLTALTRSLQISPQVAENQVLDRMALTFRKLLNFLAEDELLTQRVFLQPPHSAETQTLLSKLIAENLAYSQQNGLFRDDISAALLGQCFTGMLVQLAQNSGDPASRHQNSMACAILFCEGIWTGAA